jgi:PAS domain S-box-containing protein
VLDEATTVADPSTSGVTLDFLSHVFEAIQNPVFVKDRDFRFVFVNDAFCLFMRRARHELIGFTDFDVVPHEQARVFRDVDAAIFAGSGPHQNEETLSTPDGARFVIVTRKSVFELPDRGRYIVGVISDITDRKRMEIDLSKAKAEAESANRTKSQFLANMSHELRTPLNAIIGFSEIIKDTVLGAASLDRYRDYAADIHQSGRHLLQLINDILDLTKVEVGKYELHESECDASAIVSEAARLMQDLAQRNGVTLLYRSESDLPLLFADERAVRQIVVNLLSNAIKFTRRGGQVEIAAAAPDAGLLIRVTDTGIGMAPEDIPRALTPFVQLESSWARKFEGTGLGLPLVQALLTLHGGLLQIESEPGVGTSVAALFPSERAIRR